MAIFRLVDVVGKKGSGVFGVFPCADYRTDRICISVLTNPCPFFKKKILIP